MQSLQAVASLAGRILLSVIFVISGYGKLVAAEGTQKHMTDAGLPAVQLLYILTVIIELGGGLMVATGWRARTAAGIMFLFLIPVTLTFHWDWGNQMQQAHFLKNLGIMGGLLMVVAFGPGTVSVDGRTRRGGSDRVRRPEDERVAR